MFNKPKSAFEKILSLSFENESRFSTSHAQLLNKPEIHISKFWNKTSSDNNLTDDFKSTFVSAEKLSKIDATSYVNATPTFSSHFSSPFFFFTQKTDSQINKDSALNTSYFSNFKPTLKSLIIDHVFEYGHSSPAEEYVKKNLLVNSKSCLQLINELFIENFNNHSIITGILRVISHFNFDQVYPNGQTIALASLIHTNAEVRECGMRAYENWGTIESIRVLENIKCHEDWLESYREKVIQDLKEELECHS